MLKERKNVRLLLLSLIILLILPMAGCNYEGIGDKLYKAGKYDLAIKAYQKALDVEKGKAYGHPDVIYFKLGAAYEMKRDYNNAVRMYKMVLKINPISKLGIEAGKAILRCKANQIVGNPSNVVGGGNSSNAPLDKAGKKVTSFFDKIGDAISSIVGEIDRTTNQVLDSLPTGNSSNSGKTITSGNSSKAYLRQRLMSLQAQYDRAIDRGDLQRAQRIYKEMQAIKARM